MTKPYDTIIIGSGPSGLTAATYTSRANLKTLILAGEKWGGQLMLTTEVENYPGFGDGIMGPQLMEEMRKQSTRFGAEWVDKMVNKVDFSAKTFKVWDTDEQRYEGRSVIVSVGAEAMWLGAPGEKELTGRGVSSCAPCDGAFFKDKRVFVVGGGDAAMEEALVLTKFATEVTVLHRRDAFRASKVMIQRVLDHPKIKVFWDTEVEEYSGEPILKNVILKTKADRWEKDQEMMLSRGQGEILPTKAPSSPPSAETSQRDISTDHSPGVIRWKASIDGVFVAIGHKPSTELFKGHLELDEKGYIKNNLITNYRFTNQQNNKTNEQMNNKNTSNNDNSKIRHNDTTNPWLHGYPTMTSVPGIFAVGDGFDYRYRQAITAAGYGCMGAMDAEKWLEEER